MFIIFCKQVYYISLIIVYIKCSYKDEKKQHTIAVSVC